VVVNFVRAKNTRHDSPITKTRGGKEMKKLLFFSLVGLITLALAGMVCAQPKFEFKASGRIDAEWISGKNNPPNNAAAPAAIPGSPANFGFGGGPAFARGGGFNNSNSWLNSRGTLIFDAKMGNEVSGTVIFEIDAFRWGPNQPGTITSISERQTTGFWGADRSAVEVKNVYLDFGVPGVPIPTTLRVGVQPLAIRPLFFVYTDGPGVVMGLKADPVTISPFWFKAIEGTDFSADDVDIYGVQLRANIDKITVGGYGVYYNMNSYPLQANVPFLVGTNTIGTGLNGLAPGTQARAAFWWFGAYMDGKFGPVNVNFDILFDDGEVEGRRGLANARDVDYSGWQTRGKIDYPWEKFNFGIVAAYGSGADAKKTSANGLPGATVVNGVGTSRKVKTAVSPPGSENAFMFGESLIVYSSPVVRYVGWAANGNNFQVHSGALGGTWFAKLYGTYKVAPDFKVTLQGLYIGDTTKNANTIGNAARGIGAAIRPRDDSDIGWEFDLITELQIYKNLTWQAGLGYLFMGDAMDFRNGTAASGAALNKEPNNAWTLQSRIMYVF
jgi:hypothetical protein